MEIKKSALLVRTDFSLSYSCEEELLDDSVEPFVDFSSFFGSSSFCH